MSKKEYEVTATPKHPYYGERPVVITVSASSAADAIKQVRRIVGPERVREDGPVSYRARITNR